MVSSDYPISVGRDQVKEAHILVRVGFARAASCPQSSVRAPSGTVQRVCLGPLLETPRYDPWVSRCELPYSIGVYSPGLL
jgi:hypothetical protein